eukprot:6007292-Prymnesium_polylepis.2
MEYDADADVEDADGERAAPSLLTNTTGHAAAHTRARFATHSIQSPTADGAPRRHRRRLPSTYVGAPWRGLSYASRPVYGGEGRDQSPRDFSLPFR